MSDPRLVPGPPHGPEAFEPPPAAPLGDHATMPHGRMPPSFTAKPGVHRGTTPEMGGPLLVTPAGTTAVATDALYAHLDRLAALRDEIAHQRRAPSAIPAAPAWAPISHPPAAPR